MSDPQRGVPPLPPPDPATDPWAWSFPGAAPRPLPPPPPDPTFLERLAAFTTRGGLAGLGWGMLPPEARRRYAAAGTAIPTLLGELSPGAGIRDLVNASGDLTRATMEVNPLGMLTASSDMTLGALSAVPGTTLTKLMAAPLAAMPAKLTELMTVKEALRHRPIVIATDSHGLQGVLRDREFKHYFETGTTGGTADVATRRSVEHHGLGVPLDTPAERRPIYGSLGLAPTMHEMIGQMGYGPAVFIMRPQVKNRATYTLGDSFNFGVGPAVPWRTAPPPRTPDAVNIYPYIEAQISRLQKPLPLSDAERLLIAKPSIVTPEMRANLDRLRLPYDIMPDHLAAKPNTKDAANWWRQFGLAVPPLTVGGLWAVSPWSDAQASP